MGSRVPLRTLIRVLGSKSETSCGFVAQLHSRKIPQIHAGRSSAGGVLSLFSSRRFHSSEPEVADGDHEMFSFPGVRLHYSTQLQFTPESPKDPLPCFQLLNFNGQLIDSSYTTEFDKELCEKMYKKMVTLQVMDSILYEAQRQGRISFYLTTIGEEAVNIASAAALDDSDVIFPQYREPGVLMWRGFTLQEFADQCFGNEADLGKGRQMPIHYGSNELNYFTVASPVASQIPHAVGAAYSLKMNKAKSCAVTYFGDGGTSEGDFHAGLNFAAVLDVPVLFFCRNNAWAISTPISDQFRSDGVAVKGQAYGIRSLRIDGNDALAVYFAIKQARKMAIEESRPILIEALAYRAGHHSTSDDSTKYRRKEEIEHWQTKRDPVARLGMWMQANGWWTATDEDNFRKDIRAQMMLALQNAERRKKPNLNELFKDVYDSFPGNLKEQEMGTNRIVTKYHKDYPSDVPFH